MHEARLPKVGSPLQCLLQSPSKCFILNENKRIAERNIIIDNCATFHPLACWVCKLIFKNPASFHATTIRYLFYMHVLIKHLVSTLMKSLKF